ncbi:hypothetical protein GUJ93_ZPchr0006g45421 [Zizania palustris]|uniref:Uncharacterized protein n=1 Tax=Zizania palustris TaxID=103762 RepID=A0A8J5VSV9_ZIZPA|nr:hypothetical protein GUJ93_ZPchr0006g45421 [Zizania palustris]
MTEVAPEAGGRERYAGGQVREAWWLRKRGGSLGTGGGSVSPLHRASAGRRSRLYPRCGGVGLSPDESAATREDASALGANPAKLEVGVPRASGLACGWFATKRTAAL